MLGRSTMLVRSIRSITKQSKDTQQTLWHLGLTSQQATRHLGQAIVRIFSPSDDQYPQTGVQPFTGEPTCHSHHNRFW